MLLLPLWLFGLSKLRLPKMCLFVFCLGSNNYNISGRDGLIEMRPGVLRQRETEQTLFAIPGFS